MGAKLGTQGTHPSDVTDAREAPAAEVEHRIDGVVAEARRLRGIDETRDSRTVVSPPLQRGRILRGRSAGAGPGHSARTSRTARVSSAIVGSGARVTVSRREQARGRERLDGSGLNTKASIVWSRAPGAGRPSSVAPGARNRRTRSLFRPL